VQDDARRENRQNHHPREPLVRAARLSISLVVIVRPSDVLDDSIIGVSEATTQSTALSGAQSERDREHQILIDRQLDVAHVRRKAFANEPQRYLPGASA
jgi:hypothetical protein